MDRLQDIDPLETREWVDSLDAVLEIAPPGSRVREDLRQFQDLGLYKRPLNFPVEIAAGSP